MANRNLFGVKAATTPVAEAMPSAESVKEKPKAKSAAKKQKAQKGDKAQKPQEQQAGAAAGKKEKPQGQKEAKREGLSMIQAAQQVLAEAGTPMTCKAMVEAMADRGYWKSPKGLTPAATLYSSILRLIQRDGKQAAFRKEDRGLFALNASART